MARLADQSQIASFASVPSGCCTGHFGHWSKIKKSFYLYNFASAFQSQQNGTNYEISSEITAMDVWLGGCMAFAFLALCITVAQTVNVCDSTKSYEIDTTTTLVEQERLLVSTDYSNTGEIGQVVV